MAMASSYLSIFSRSIAARAALEPHLFSWRFAHAQAKYRFASALQASTLKQATKPRGFGWGMAGTITAAALGFSVFSNSRSIYCIPANDAQTTAAPVKPLEAETLDPSPGFPPFPEPPKSSVNLYELSFGTACGICAGVFLKKGAKALAFALGGVFVLLQYLGSKSIVKVDWSRVSKRFESVFYVKDGVADTRRPPTIYSLWRRLVDFLTADFQPRASFIAGLMLGIRIG